jgi:hypothetical protein
MILVAAVILVGVFLVATGRGGELAYEHADHAPLDLGPISATDVALLRPPTALWGYNMQVTDEALDRIAQAVRDRDVTIAFLQQRLADQTTQANQTALALPPAEPPQAHRAELGWSGEPAPSAPPAADDGPPTLEHPADPPADTSTSALAAEEQTW